MVTLVLSLRTRSISNVFFLYFHILCISAIYICVNQPKKFTIAVIILWWRGGAYESSDGGAYEVSDGGAYEVSDGGA